MAYGVPDTCQPRTVKLCYVGRGRGASLLRIATGTSFCLFLTTAVSAASAAMLQVSGITVIPLLETDGSPANSSLVSIPFDEPITLLDGKSILLSGEAIGPVSGSLKLLDIPISFAAIDASILNLTTGVLVPQGASLLIGEGGLGDLNSQPFASFTTVLPQGISTELFTLANKPLIPTDISLFTSAFYPDAPPPVVLDSPRLEQEVFQNLTAFLQRKVERGLILQGEKAALESRFLSEESKAIVPDPNLRAAILSLAGTSFDQAIATIFDGENFTGQPITTDFRATSEFPTPGALAESITLPDGHLAIVFNEILSGEPFQVLSAIIAHETVHLDRAVGRPEEIIASLFEPIAYAEQLLADPTIAALKFSGYGSSYTRTLNESLLAILNSGDLGFPNLGLSEAPLLQDPPRFNPGGADVEVFSSFERVTQAIYQGSPNVTTVGNPTVQSYIENITQQSLPELELSQDTIAFLDGNISIFSPAQQIELAGILRLTLPDRPPRQLSSEPTSVPEPMPVVGLLAVALSGLYYKRLRQI